MSLPSFASQTVTVWRAPLAADGHGNQTRDWDNATSHDLVNVLVTRAGGTVDRLNRTAVTTLWTVRAEADADVLSTDRVEVYGVRYDIDGPVGQSLTSVLDTIRIPLKAVSG